MLTWLLIACTSLQVPNLAFYQFTDNRSINLLEFQYADYHDTYEKEISDAIGKISFTSRKAGEFMYIKWQDKSSGEIKSEKIPLTTGLPFDMREAQIRLTFNSSNQPEVYVFYSGSNPSGFFMFKGYPYYNVQVRQIYPINQEIRINIKQKNN